MLNGWVSGCRNQPSLGSKHQHPLEDAHMNHINWVVFFPQQFSANNQASTAPCSLRLPLASSPSLPFQKTELIAAHHPWINHLQHPLDCLLLPQQVSEWMIVPLVVLNPPPTHLTNMRKSSKWVIFFPNFSGWTFTKKNWVATTQWMMSEGSVQNVQHPDWDLRLVESSESSRPKTLFLGFGSAF